MISSRIHKDYCLICVSRCPKAGLRYSWNATKQFYDGTMEHFELFGEGRRSNNPRYKYETKHYYEREFACKGFWKLKSKYVDWRMRYQGNFKKLKLKGCFA